ncbi:hypothetical protein BO85DRAFT_36237 [Aspergillus piperis CBS 112811]|uniref:Uncharacterized protein n=1 Tax=Aspergillus piperis CBS 112811 TaxID=1448313 RepID=A0A8G1R0R0_9EURO|nr:hypothetical protein BO85DRAFT_36237 [Aspergillus piperis CBS 112811]RAH57249.1 hypothetical protein BO85DRAFT_36237 [Aspergillus piperis CBS 112811]
MTAPPGRPAPRTLLDRPVNESPKLTAGRITGNAGVTPGLAPCYRRVYSSTRPGENWPTARGRGRGRMELGGRNGRNNKSARDRQWIDKTRGKSDKERKQKRGRKRQFSHKEGKKIRPRGCGGEKREGIRAIRTGMQLNPSTRSGNEDRGGGG